MVKVFSKAPEIQRQHEERSFERGIFSVLSDPETRIIQDHDLLIDKIMACRELGLSIVMTSGSFDLTHIGHARYLEEAKRHGDILVVGVDSDEKVRQRKGYTRPIVPDSERMELLAHLKPVDLVTIKHADEPKWELIKRIAPDTLIVTDETYDSDVLDELADYCGRVMCLERQATTSTSAQVRMVEISWRDTIRQPIENILRSDGVSEETIRKVGHYLTRDYEPKAE